MKKHAFAIVLAASAGLYGQAAQVSSVPQFTKDNKLVLPKDYREWIFLSSGLGMTYGTPEAARRQNFDNVFVHPAAYRAFIQTGHWPDHTMFILETRAATGKGSINQGGHFQSDLIGLAAEVKDRAHAPEGEWAYFGFGTEAQTAVVLPKTAPCYACHSRNAAVENTFVQFYPTLLPIAKAKGTVKLNIK